MPALFSQKISLVYMIYMKIIKIKHTKHKLLNLDKFKIFLETKYIIVHLLWRRFLLSLL